MKTAFLLIWFAINTETFKGDCKGKTATACTMRTQQFETYDRAEQAAKAILTKEDYAGDTAVIYEIMTGKRTKVERKETRTPRLEFSESLK